MTTSAKRRRNQLSIRPVMWLVLLVSAGGCGGSGRLVSKPVLLAGKTMGTTYHITLAAIPSGASRETLAGDIKQLLDDINGKMSTYDKQSELSRFNASTSTEWQTVSAETATVVSQALEISRKTNGAFDVTVGPLVNLWNFGPEPGKFQVPSDESIAKTLQGVGYRRLSARLSPPGLKKEIPALYVDLSAIAKGYAVDAVAQLLIDRNVESFLVEIGGEVRTQGKKSDGSAWRLGIETPDSKDRSVLRAVELTDHAMATSGDYRNFFRVGDQQYSHTIDPTSGRPITHRLTSVSVIGASCSQCDAWATAMLVLGPQRAMELAEANSLAVLLVERGTAPQQGKLIQRGSTRFITEFGKRINSP